MRCCRKTCGLLCVLLIALAFSGWGDPSSPEIYGYLESGTGLTSYTDDDSADTWKPGAYTRLRLKGDWEPEERLRFHLETEWTTLHGTDSPDFSAGRLGLDSLSGWEASDTGELQVEHAWGLLDLGNFDLQAGKIPLAWGTAYVFNPSARVNPADSLNPGGDEETPGITGISSSIYLKNGVTLSTYLAAEDRGRKADPDMIAHNAANIPWGTRIRGFAGPFDLSLGILREILYDTRTSGYERPLWLSSDGVGTIAGINLYWEAALCISDPSGDPADGSWDFKDNLEFAAGFHALPSVLQGVEVRGEYFFQGTGSSRESGYEVLPVLEGTRKVMGRHYLFGYLEKRFFDYHLVSCGSVLNTGDLSGAVFSEYSWELTANSRFSLGSIMYYGSGEFQGLIDLSILGTGTGSVDMAGNRIYAELRISF
ncbi:hypothetical protein B4O97_15325 [Marispirochaeta aestuarii]|uniref:Alginate export domain-containing protein n=1 Tax=Marispirochaeta aestuarii TaxID=1963862 RepID=A0A1Y1RVV9_9SPIO|nr:hypothetical protein [Marispirochaeta aestuarii]ORC32823.1 hypothetical protein B4O97_15325 [Marispirochaeta aestuarii]